MTIELDQNADTEIASLLIGRRIVEAEMGDFKIPDREESWYSNTASGLLRLDDGTEIYIRPNEGGCACNAGDYELEKLATVDNAISNVELIADEGPREWGEGPTTYRIHVVADAVDMDIVTIEGDDGNGYYGTGYALFVILPEEHPDA